MYVSENTTRFPNLMVKARTANVGKVEANVSFLCDVHHAP